MKYQNKVFLQTAGIFVGLTLITNIALSKVEKLDPFSVLRKSVVKVSAIGSGSVVEAGSGTKYILTNWHVCQALPSEWARHMQFADGHVEDGKQVDVDPYHDLCLIEANQDRPALKLGKGLKIGDTLFTRGYPRGILKESTGKLLTEDSAILNFAEEVTAETCPKGFLKRSDFFNPMAGCLFEYKYGYTSLYSQPGSSGSPVVDKTGELVGVVQLHDGGNAAPKQNAGIILYEDVKEFLEKH